MKGDKLVLMHAATDKKLNALVKKRDSEIHHRATKIGVIADLIEAAYKKECME